MLGCGTAIKQDNSRSRAQHVGVHLNRPEIEARKLYCVGGVPRRVLSAQCRRQEIPFVHMNRQRSRYREKFVGLSELELE